MMKVKKFAKYIALAAALLFLAVAIIIYPERYVQTTLQGFLLWAECVLPSLFPFMVITLIFIKCGLAEKAALPLRRVTGAVKLPPAASICFIMSVCSGYPAGARIVSEFYEGGAIDKTDCKKLAYLCSTSGPLFIIGSVGFKMFGDKGAGGILFAAHAIAVFTVAIIISLCSKKRVNGTYYAPNRSNNVLYDSFYAAVISVCVAGGFIAFFVTAARVCADFGLLIPLEKLFTPLLGKEVAAALCTGLFESTAGCKALAGAGGKLALPLAGAVITFGGISIVFQQLCYLLKCGVSPLKFIAVKFLQAVICFLIVLLIISVTA